MSDRASALSVSEFLRFLWRQLTSMRTALVLLLLLALVSIPGSIFPQRNIDASAVQRYFIDNPELAPVLDRFGFFNMYSSPIFGAVYLLLMISLIGCILPRTAVYARALTARPPRAPKNLDRLGGYGSFETQASASVVLETARQRLGRARIESNITEISAEKGYLRELGNLVFHIAIVFVLIGFVGGSLFAYKGAVIVVEGETFANNLTQFDEFGSGAFFEQTDLPPFTLSVDEVTAEFELEGEQRGAPRKFLVEGSLVESPGGDKRSFDLEVNRPLSIGDSTVHLVGVGYAPVIKVTDATGRVAFDGPVVFLPEDGTYLSSGVIKVPDSRPHDLGFQGFFLPTAVTTGDEAASISAFPAAANPYLGLFAYFGDLSMDQGRPQSVYILNQDKLTQFENEDGSEFEVQLQPGQATTLPDGAVIEFSELKQFARLQIASVPLTWLTLVAIILATSGLILSLYIRPRRWWVRVTTQGPSTVVEIGALDKVPRGDLATVVASFAEQLEQDLRGEE